jgi:arthrofactin-type cyclic lipopeptide synthetase C
MALRTGYKPDAIYQGPMHLVLVDDKRLDQDANLRRHERIVETWSRSAPNLTCIKAPGNHMTMLKAPNLLELVRLMNLG